ncbi:MAG: hypothetical protein FJY92_00040, partial [Candidatus Hydrogenedentes bacterium]|nr:hypothetical protein [Candidatus Hydrogenedentota bacterium]
MTMEKGVLLVHVPISPDVASLSPPLGLLYLTSVLRAHSIPVRFFDLRNEQTPWNCVEQAVSDTHLCLVGFSCDSENIHRVLRLSNRLLMRFPHVTVVLGGPHVTHEWRPFVTDRRIVVRGEGEYSLLLLAKN